MPGVPSNKACERCKKKHMKCDETRPQCQRCQAAKVECPGYVQTRKFIDQGATVRRRFAPYQDCSTKGVASPLQGPEDPTFSVNRADSGNNHEQESQRRWESPFNREITNAWEDPNSELLLTDKPGQTLHSPSGIPNNMSVSDAHASSTPSHSRDAGMFRVPAQSSVSPDTTRTASGSSAQNEAHDPLGENSQSSWEIEPQQNEVQELQSLITDIRTDTEHEMAFLMRHFAENIGCWLDISDSANFFSVLLPIRASKTPLLKYAVAAITAKQLGLVKGVLQTSGSNHMSSASSQGYPNSLQVDWFLKAANYFYLASSTLNASFSEHYTAMSSSAVFDSPIQSLTEWIKFKKFAGTGQLSYDSIFREVENHLATVTLMVFYRLLDSSVHTWHSHLSGINHLFELIMALTGSHTALMTHGIRASFWAFARFDICGSYIRRQTTQFNPMNLHLWRAAGTSIDDSKGFHIVTDNAAHFKQEEQAFNGLMWLMSRVVNFLAQLETSHLDQWMGSPVSTPRRGMEVISHPGAIEIPNSTAWLDLCLALQSWFEEIPETFSPCIRLESPKSQDGTHLPFPEIFFSSPVCATAMQHYHFARVALLLNKPEEDTLALNNAFDRLKGYREVTKEVEFRCREVCGIAVGRPHSAVRVQMIPLLFGVGKCLEGSQEHEIILRILTEIQSDLGLKTDTVVSTLAEAWMN